MGFRENVQALLAQRGWSQRELATAAGISPGAVGSILDRHEEIQDWTILYTQRELGMRYPGIDFSTASTLAKIATDPGLSKEFDQSLTADAIERMRAVPLPDRPEQRSDAGLPMPDPGIDPNSGNGPMGPGIGM